MILAALGFLFGLSCVIFGAAVGFAFAMEANRQRAEACTLRDEAEAVLENARVALAQARVAHRRASSQWS